MGKTAGCCLKKYFHLRLMEMYMKEAIGNKRFQAARSVKSNKREVKTMGHVFPRKDKKYDIAALGEALIDFTEAGSNPSGTRLFEQNPGGAPANLVCAAARFGARTAFIGKVGDDMHGRFLIRTLEECGVDTAGVVTDGDVFTTLAFVALTGGEREFSFARKPGADTCLTSEEINNSIIDSAAIFHIGSLSLTNEPARSATYSAIKRAAGAGAIISYDPNYRPILWSSREEALSQMKGPLSAAQAVKLSADEAEFLCGCSDPESAAKKLSLAGIPIIAVTLGKEGALVCREGRCETVAGYEAEAVDTTGAGDSFWGAFLYCLLKSGKAPEEVTLEEAASFAGFANAAASLCVTRRGGIPAMPTAAEIRRKMEKS